MKKIVGVSFPFELKQNYYVYEDGNKIDSVSLKLDEIPNQILAWSKEYNVKRVDLAGPQQYNRGLKRRILEAEKNKYNKNELEINIV